MIKFFRKIHPFFYFLILFGLVIWFEAEFLTDVHPVIGTIIGLGILVFFYYVIFPRFSLNEKFLENFHKNIQYSKTIGNAIKNPRIKKRLFWIRLPFYTLLSGITIYIWVVRGFEELKNFYLVTGWLLVSIISLLVSREMLVFKKNPATREAAEFFQKQAETTYKQTSVMYVVSLAIFVVAIIMLVIWTNARLNKILEENPNIKIENGNVRHINIK